LGKGTEFKIELKFKKADIQENISENNQAFDFNGLRILFVEDNKVNSFYLRTVLEKNGFFIDEANEGEQAVEKCKNSNYDLILMDLQMPVMDGLTASRIIRKELKLSTPIIAQSANTVQKDIDACFEIGINDYLSKPFTIDQLKSKIAFTLKLKPQYTSNSLPVAKIKQTNETLEKFMEITDNNLDFAKNLIDVFISETPPNLKLLGKAVDKRELSETNKLGHKIKSSFRLLKMTEAADLCLFFEKFDQKEFDWVMADLNFEKLDKVAKKIIKETKKIQISI